MKKRKKKKTPVGIMSDWVDSIVYSVKPLAVQWVREAQSTLADFVSRLKAAL